MRSHRRRVFQRRLKCRDNSCLGSAAQLLSLADHAKDSNPARAVSFVFGVMATFFFRVAWAASVNMAPTPSADEQATMKAPDAPPFYFVAAILVFANTHKNPCPSERGGFIYAVSVSSALGCGRGVSAPHVESVRVALLALVCNAAALFLNLSAFNQIS
jgi:hypothetical protein